MGDVVLISAFVAGSVVLDMLHACAKRNMPAGESICSESAGEVRSRA